jgi:hypothetical protein
MIMSLLSSFRADITKDSFMYKPRNDAVYLSRQSNVINSQNHLDCLSGQLDGAGTHQQWLQHVLLGDIVLDAAALDANTRVLLPLCVSMPQVGYHLDAVQPSILCQRRGDDFQGIRERFPANGLRAGELASLCGELVCDFNFGGTATGKERLLLDERADGAVGVMEGPLGLLENERVCAAADNRDSLCGSLDARYLDVPRTGSIDFFDEVSLAELIFCERVDVCDRLAASALLSVRTLRIHEDIHVNLPCR